MILERGGREVRRWGPYATVREAKAALAEMVERHGGWRGLLDAEEP